MSTHPTAGGRTTGPFTSAPQKGVPGHCFAAQVFGPDGKSVATLDATQNEDVATGYANLFAAAPDLMRALEALERAAQAHLDCADGSEREYLREEMANARAALAKTGGA